MRMILNWYAIFSFGIYYMFLTSRIGGHLWAEGQRARVMLHHVPGGQSERDSGTTDDHSAR